jgi:Skp family chaperone for outer membrane proteins
MRCLIAGLALTAMTASAYGQAGPGSSINNASRIGEHAEKATQVDKATEAKVKANEKAYNAALHNLPDKQYDPWHGVR